MMKAPADNVLRGVRSPCCGAEDALLVCIDLTHGGYMQCDCGSEVFLDDLRDQARRLTALADWIESAPSTSRDEAA